jgi:hypothetical protein
MWDNLTSETELGLALREIRRADPEFVVEDWVRDISDNFLPSFFESYLRGDLKTLQVRGGRFGGGGLGGWAFLLGVSSSI